MFSISQDSYSFISSDGDGYQIDFIKVEGSFQVTISPMGSGTFSRIEKVFFCAKREYEFSKMNTQLQEKVLQKFSKIDSLSILFTDQGHLKIYNADFLKKLSRVTDYLIF